MKLSEWTANLIRAIEELNEHRERDAFLSVHEGLALVKLRVPNDGVNANGQKFKGYSKNPLRWWWLTNYTESRREHGLRDPDFQIDNVIDRLKKDMKKAGAKFASYYDFRKAAKRPVDRKTFSFTGDMWASIRAFIKGKSKTKIVVEVKSSFPFYNDTVIPAHSNREGINILKTSKAERNLIFRAYRDRRLSILKKNNVLK